MQIAMESLDKYGHLEPKSAKKITPAAAMKYSDNATMKCSDCGCEYKNVIGFLKHYATYHHKLGKTNSCQEEVYCQLCDITCKDDRNWKIHLVSKDHISQTFFQMIYDTMPLPNKENSMYPSYFSEEDRIALEKVPAEMLDVIVMYVILYYHKLYKDILKKNHPRVLGGLKDSIMDVIRMCSQEEYTLEAGKKGQLQLIVYGKTNRTRNEQTQVESIFDRMKKVVEKITPDIRRRIKVSTTFKDGYIGFIEMTCYIGSNNDYKIMHRVFTHVNKLIRSNRVAMSRRMKSKILYYQKDEKRNRQESLNHFKNDSNDCQNGS